MPIGAIHVSTQLLHSMLLLPPEARVLPDRGLSDEVVLLIEHPEAPAVDEGMLFPTITPVIVMADGTPQLDHLIIEGA